jgi:hypothetical protein
MTAKPPNITTDAGISVASDEYSLTVGPADPNLLRAICHFLVPDPLQERLLAPVATIRKLGAHSRCEAVPRARAIGLLTGPSASSRTPVWPDRGAIHDGGRGHGVRARRT